MGAPVGFALSLGLDSSWGGLDGMGAMLNILSQQRCGLNVCYFNSRSLRNKIDELRTVFDQTKVHVICVSESWLNDSVSTSSVSLPGFKLHRCDRVGRVGGGVAVYVSNILNSKVVKSSVGSGIDFICVEVASSDSKCLIASVYSPPNCFTSPNIVELENALSHLSHCYEDMIICGDFNVNLHAQGSSRILIQDFLLSLDLQVLNDLPTYYNASVPSMLDLLLTTNAMKALFLNQLSPPSILDHDILFLCYDFHIERRNIPLTKTYRNLQNIDIEALSARCVSLSWDDIYNLPEAEEKLSRFMSCIDQLLDEFAPVETRIIRSGGIPWFSHEIRRLIEEREFLYNRYRHTRSPELHLEYKRVRNLVTAKIKSAKREYFRRRFDTNLPQRRLWSNLRNHGVHNKASPDCDFDADLLNSYFSTAAVSPPIPNLFTDTYSDQGFSFRCFGADEVYEAIFSIKSEAIGSDNLPPRFIKLILPYILPVLTHIFNSCVTTSVFPRAWKHAIVLPIAKTSSPRAACDFRPISILCFLSKVFERLLRDQLQAYLQSNSLITERQSGYRKHHSCEAVLLKVTTDIRFALDGGHICYLSLLDFSKAFDSLNHRKLLDKLSHKFKLSRVAIKLICSFLSGRSQQVKVDRQLSRVSAIEAGVPQGSILGPLLFSLFIDDLPDVVLYSSIHMYADDVQLYITGPVGLAVNLADKMNEDLWRVSNWAVNNGLKLNATKSVYMVVTRLNNDTANFPGIKLNGQDLTCVNKAKNLGIVLNSKMTCCDHVAAALGKVYGTLRRLWLFASLLPIPTRLRLVKTLILPFFTFGSLVYPAMDAVCCNRIKVAFNDCIRFVFGLRRHDHVSRYQLTILGCSIDAYIKFRILCFLHKLVYIRDPPYLYRSVTFLGSSRRLDMLLPRFNALVAERSFPVQAFRLWNSLPSALQRLGPVGVFRRHIFRYLTDTS